jgi:hypothetical protein
MLAARQFFGGDVCATHQVDESTHGHKEDQSKEELDKFDHRIVVHYSNKASPCALRYYLDSCTDASSRRAYERAATGSTIACGRAMSDDQRLTGDRFADHGGGDTKDFAQESRLQDWPRRAKR